MTDSQLWRFSHRYLIQATLKSEGRFRVLRAYDRIRRSSVIIKGKLSDADDPGQEMVLEFHRLRNFAHPRVPDMLDVGKTASFLPALLSPTKASTTFVFFTQEFIPGPSLWELRGALTAPRVQQCAKELLELLAWLHHFDVVNLDLKPAHLIQNSLGWYAIDLGQTSLTALTDAPTLSGTAPYAAPELLNGSRGGVCQDLYSAGAMLYEALTGKSPIPPGMTLNELRTWLPCSSIPTLPSSLSQEVPLLSALLLRLLSRNPLDRPASALEALELLNQPRSAWRAVAPLPEGSAFQLEKPLLLMKTAYEQARANAGGCLVVSSPPNGGLSRYLSESALMLAQKEVPALLVDPAQLETRALTAVRSILEFLDTPVGLHDSLPETMHVQRTLTLDEARQQQAHDFVLELFQCGKLTMLVVQGPVVVLIDGFERIDALSREILERLVPALEGSGFFLVLGTHHSGPDPLDMGALPTLYLEPLSSSLLHDYSETLLGPGALTENDVKALMQRTEGHIGDLREALRSRFRNPAGVWDHQPLTLDCRVHSLVADLSPSALRIAMAASVFDMPVTSNLISQVLGEDVHPSDLVRLIDNGLWKRHSSSIGADAEFRFVTEALRHTVLSLVEPAKAKVYHAGAAEACERLLNTDATIAPVQIAHHFMASEMPHRARPYFRLALDDAFKRLDPVGACTILQQLIQITPDKDPQRAELFRRLAEVELDLGQYLQAKNTFEVVLKEEPNMAAARRARCLAGLGRALIYLRELDKACESLRTVLLDPTLLIGLNSNEVIPWWHRLAWIYVEQNKLESARDSLSQASQRPMATASRLGVDHQHLMTILDLRSGAEPDVLKATLVPVLQQAEELNYRKGVRKVMNTLAHLSHLQKDSKETQRWLEQIILVARADFDRLAEAIGNHNLGVHLRSSDPRAAVDRFERAAKLYQVLHNREGEVANILIVVELLIDHDDFSRAKEYIERAKKADIEQGTRLYVALLELRIRSILAPDAETILELKSLVDALTAAGHVLLAVAAVKDSLTLAIKLDRIPDALLILAQAATLPQCQSERAIWSQIYQLAVGIHSRLLASMGGAVDNPPPKSSPPLVQLETSRVLPQATPVAAEVSEGHLSLNFHRPEEAFAGSEHSRWLERIRNLLEVADDESALAGRIAELAGDLFGGRGLVFLFDGVHREVVRSSYLNQAPIDDVSSTVTDRVLSTGVPLICPDVVTDAELSQQRSLRGAPFRSIMCYPILQDQRCIGAIYVDHPTAGVFRDLNVQETMQQLCSLVGNCLKIVSRRKKPLHSHHFSDLDSVSPAMEKLMSKISGLLRSESPDIVALLLGPTGAGKSMIARMIHTQGKRHKGPFIEVNCAGIPDGLIQELMFGHEKGTFTGAAASKPGWFEVARGGTLFLDEIGLMPRQHQMNLLSVLGSRKFRRLGAEAREQDLDVCIICATNRDLEQAIRENQFLPDLYRRIKVNVLVVPSLRERGPNDIRLLTSRMIRNYLITQKRITSDAPPIELRDYLSIQAENFLCEYDWPFNIGDLSNLFQNEDIRGKLLARFDGRSDEKISRQAIRDALAVEWQEQEETPGKRSRFSVPDRQPTGRTIGRRDSSSGAPPALPSEPFFTPQSLAVGASFDDGDQKLLHLFRRYRFRVADFCQDPECPVERATADTYLRILMFKSLIEGGWNVGHAVQILAGNSDPQLLLTIHRRMETTLANLRSRLHSEGAEALTKKLARHYRGAYKWVEAVLSALTEDRIRS